MVIEMPRDRNSDEQKKWEKETQKRTKKNRSILKINWLQYMISDFHRLISLRKKQLNLKLKLWNEQDGKCLYSGKIIEPEDLIKHSELFEIDHIIPRSISFDDSRNNKVLVYRTENQGKGNQTPYYYLTHANNKWSFEQYKALVMDLSKKREYGLSKRKCRICCIAKMLRKQMYYVDLSIEILMIQVMQRELS